MSHILQNIALVHQFAQIAGNRRVCDLINQYAYLGDYHMMRARQWAQYFWPVLSMLPFARAYCGDMTYRFVLEIFDDTEDDRGYLSERLTYTMSCPYCGEFVVHNVKASCKIPMCECPFWDDIRAGDEL